MLLLLLSSYSENLQIIRAPTKDVSHVQLSNEHDADEMHTERVAPDNVSNIVADYGSNLLATYLYS